MENEIKSSHHWEVNITSLGADSFSSDYSSFDEENKRFQTKEEALTFIEEKYKGHKREAMYMDYINTNETVQVGWIYKFRNADFSHAPLKWWNQQDWIVLKYVTETPVLY